MTSRDPQPCEIPADEHQGRVRFYITGWRCNAHAPWAEKGLPEPQPGPGMPAGAWSTPSPQSASAVFDNRAIASGKRRSSPAAYRAARAAVGRAPEPAPGIRLDPGQRDATGRTWIRVPNADYLCPACCQTESASGDQVAHFAAHIEAEHAERCPANQQGAPTA
ncbi:hypothetical protein AB0N17_03295 [Streptomyces sp. NPDC051133]|uniref:hypothetical protein n=1 Tax=Streptomyces sp. NPDC051133 TaxID=3155521 RepID=UPI00341AB6D9